MYSPPQTGNRPGRIEDNQRGRHCTGAEGFSWDLPFARQNQWSNAPWNEPSPWLWAAWPASSFGKFLHAIGHIESFVLLCQRIQSSAVVILGNAFRWLSTQRLGRNNGPCKHPPGKRRTESDPPIPLYFWRSMFLSGDRGKAVDD